MQEGGTVSGLRFPKSDGLGSQASIYDLFTSGARPGEVGVTVTDRTVRLGDVFDLSQRSGIEFSLVTERVDGKLVKRLYSGKVHLLISSQIISKVYNSWILQVY